MINEGRSISSLLIGLLGVVVVEELYCFLEGFFVMCFFGGNFLFHFIPVVIEVLAMLHLGFQMKSYIRNRALVDTWIQLFGSAVEYMSEVIPQDNSTICQICLIGLLLASGWRIWLMVLIIWDIDSSASIQLKAWYMFSVRSSHLGQIGLEY